MVIARLRGVSLCAGIHLPSDLSDFGKGHTLDLAYIMEERRHEAEHQLRMNQERLAEAVQGQGSIQPIFSPGKFMPRIYSMQYSLHSRLAYLRRAWLQ